MAKTIQKTILASLIALLTACGGGGSSSESAPVGNGDNTTNPGGESGTGGDNSGGDNGAGGDNGGGDNGNGGDNGGDSGANLQPRTWSQPIQLSTGQLVANSPLLSSNPNGDFLATWIEKNNDPNGFDKLFSVTGDISVLEDVANHRKLISENTTGLLITPMVQLVRVTDDVRGQDWQHTVRQAISDNGTALIIWQQRTNGSNDYSLVYSMLNPNTGSWSAPVEIDTTTDGSARPFTSIHINQSQGSGFFVTWQKRQSDTEGASHYELVAKYLNQEGQATENLALSHNSRFAAGTVIFNTEQRHYTVSTVRYNEDVSKQLITQYQLSVSENGLVLNNSHDLIASERAVDSLTGVTTPNGDYLFYTEVDEYGWSSVKGLYRSDTDYTPIGPGPIESKPYHAGHLNVASSDDNKVHLVWAHRQYEHYDTVLNEELITAVFDRAELVSYKELYDKSGVTYPRIQNGFDEKLYLSWNGGNSNPKHTEYINGEWVKPTGYICDAGTECMLSGKRDFTQSVNGEYGFAIWRTNTNSIQNTYLSFSN